MSTASCETPFTSSEIFPSFSLVLGVVVAELASHLSISQGCSGILKSPDRKLLYSETLGFGHARTMD